MPVLTWSGAFISWFVLSAAIALGSIAIHGWPKASEWTSTWLPGLLGPALLIGTYAGVAWLGQRCNERQIRAMTLD